MSLTSTAKPEEEDEIDISPQGSLNIRIRFTGTEQERCSIAEAMAELILETSFGDAILEQYTVEMTSNPKIDKGK